MPTSSSNNKVARTCGRVLLGLSMALLPLQQVTAQNAYLRPDTSFGSAGSVNTSLAGNGGWYNSSYPAQPTTLQSLGQLLQANNRLWVCGGNSGSFEVQCYLPDGTPDAAFGTNGRVTTAFTNRANASGIAMQPDGKLVVVGAMEDAMGGVIHVVAAARYDQTGALDPSFGTGGKMTGDPNNGPDINPKRVVVLANGNLLVAGIHTGGYSSVVLRLLPSGQPDTSFNNGSAYTSYSEYIQEMVASPTGQVLLIGNDNTPGTGTNGTVVRRLTSTGTLDPSFGTAGSVVVNGTDVYMGQRIRAFTECFGVAMQPSDGKILLAGRVHNTASTSAGNSPVLLRLNPIGTPDTTFNRVAMRSIYLTGNLLAVSVTATGDILVAGSANNTNSPRVLLARYTSAGVLDPSFSPPNNPVQSYVPAGAYAQVLPSGVGTASSLTIQPDGKIVTLGGYETNNSLRLARYMTNQVSATRSADATVLQLQAAPVPTAGPVELHYTLPLAATVRLELSDQLGRIVAVPVAGQEQAAGPQALLLDTQTLAAGCYFCRLEAGDLRQTIRVSVVR